MVKTAAKATALSTQQQRLARFTVPFNKDGTPRADVLQVAKVLALGLEPRPTAVQLSDLLGGTPGPARIREWMRAPELWDLVRQEALQLVQEFVPSALRALQEASLRGNVQAIDRVLALAGLPVLSQEQTPQGSQPHLHLHLHGGGQPDELAQEQLRFFKEVARVPSVETLLVPAMALPEPGGNGNGNGNGKH